MAQTPIVDHRGRPITSRDLQVEHGDAMIGHVRSPERRSVATTLTPSNLGALMRAADQGDVESMFILAEEIEEREPHTRSQLQMRTMAVTQMPRSVVAGGSSAQEEAIAEDVEETILEQPAFAGLLTDLMDAVFKGISCVEILWKRGARRWEPIGYEFRPQRHFVFDRETFREPRLRTDTDPTYGEALSPGKWLLHAPKSLSGLPLRRGLVRPVAICYAAKRYTVADLLSFLDIFGQPIRLGRYPAHLREHRNELMRALRSIGADASAVIPEEMQVELLEARAASGADNIFLGTAEYWDKQVSKVVLGQTMSSDDGSSLSQAQVHERVRFDIRDHDAASLLATINRQLVRTFVDLNYGAQETYPHIEIGSAEAEDAASFIDTVTKFVALGGKVKLEEVQRRLGFSAPDDGDEVLERSAAPVPEEGDDATPTPPRDDEQPGRALNRAAFAAVAEEAADEWVSDWRPLVEDNVGVLLRELREAEDYDAALAVLDKTSDADALRKLTAALARSTYQARGVGDATDEPEV